MTQPLPALGEYRTRLERARREAREALVAATTGLVGKQVAWRRKSCGPPQEDDKSDAGTVAEVESVLDGGYPDFIVLKLTTGDHAYIDPEEEDIFISVP